MNNSGYTIRNYRSEDLDKYIQLQLEAEEITPTVPDFSSQSVIERIRRPGYSPEQDLFLAVKADKFVGYLDITPELAIGRVLLDCWIHPEHRRKGLAAMLCQQSMLRAKEIGARVLQVNITESNRVARKVLPRLGFIYIRRFLELRLDMSETGWADPDYSTVQYRHLQSGEEAKLTQIQNTAFTGTWGFNLNTVEEISYRLNLSNHSPEDVVLIEEVGKFIAYCWVSITEDRASAVNKMTGRITMIGVDPAYRGQGYGKKALIAGLLHMNKRGVTVVELTADSENRIALSLYESVGFKHRTNSLWYEKPVN